MVGGPFGQFGIANYSDGGVKDCVISGVPATFVPCESFVLTLTSNIAFGHKFGSSVGTLSNVEVTTTKQKANCRHSSAAKQTVTKYRWTAPPGKDATNVSFTALCGDMKTNVVLFAARPKVSVLNNTGAVFQNECPFDVNVAVDPDPTNTAQLVQDNIPLMAGIGGSVVVGLAVAGLFAYKRKNKRNPGDEVVDKLEDVGNTIKQRMQSMRPAMPLGGNGRVNDVATQNMMMPYQNYANAQSFASPQQQQPQQYRQQQQQSSTYNGGYGMTLQNPYGMYGGSNGYSNSQQQQSQMPYGMNYNGYSAQNPAFRQ